MAKFGKVLKGCRRGTYGNEEWQGCLHELRVTGPLVDESNVVDGIALERAVWQQDSRPWQDRQGQGRQVRACGGSEPGRSLGVKESKMVQMASWAKSFETC